MDRWLGWSGHCEPVALNARRWEVYGKCFLSLCGLVVFLFARSLFASVIVQYAAPSAVGALESIAAVAPVFGISPDCVVKGTLEYSAPAIDAMITLSRHNPMETIWSGTGWALSNVWGSFVFLNGASALWGDFARWGDSALWGDFTMAATNIAIYGEN